MVYAETEDFWVFNKPCGISVNDSDQNPGFISQQKSALGVELMHPVHRLDADTSGLLLVAKHAESNKALSNAFQKKEVEKTYLAIIRSKSGGKVTKKQGWIIGDMKPSRNGSWMLLRSKANPAITYFKTVSLGDRYRFAMLSPKTGKTHQLRVALKANGTPILGDKRYGGEQADRLYLHAYALTFHYSGKEYRYQLKPDLSEHFSEDVLDTIESDLAMFLSSQRGTM